MIGDINAWSKVIAIIAIPMTVCVVSFGVDMMVSHERIEKLEKKLQACNDKHTPPGCGDPLQQFKVICGKDDKEICKKECGEYFPETQVQVFQPMINKSNCDSYCSEYHSKKETVNIVITCDNPSLPVSSPPLPNSLPPCKDGEYKGCMPNLIIQNDGEIQTYPLSETGPRKERKERKEKK